MMLPGLRWYSRRILEKKYGYLGFYSNGQNWLEDMYCFFEKNIFINHFRLFPTDFLGQHIRVRAMARPGGLPFQINALEIFEYYLNCKFWSRNFTTNFGSVISFRAPPHAALIDQILAATIFRDTSVDWIQARRNISVKTVNTEKWESNTEGYRFIIKWIYSERIVHRFRILSAELSDGHRFRLRSIKQRIEELWLCIQLRSFRMKVKGSRARPSGKTLPDRIVSFLHGRSCCENHSGKYLTTLYQGQICGSV